MTDDGVGLEALQEFAGRYVVPEEVDLVDGGTLGLDLLVYMEGYRDILITDCVALGREPGTLVRVEGEDVAPTFAQCLSPHQMGLRDLIAVLELQGRTPQRLTVLGVEAADLEVGETLSAPVQAALPRLVEAMAAVLTEWGRPPARRGAGGAGCPGESA